MDPLLSPSTAALLSFLEDSAFDTPSMMVSGAGDPDVFSHAFEKYNVKQNSVLRNPDGLSPASEAPKSDRRVETDQAERYITPPGTSKSFTAGISARSTDRGHELELPHLPNSAFFSELEEDTSMANSWTPQVISGFDTCSTTVYDQPLVRKTRKRKPITQTEKELKHQKFLERNRKAANNCRQRKKSRNESLEQDFKAIEARNALLKLMREDLMVEAQELREELDKRGQEETGNGALAMKEGRGTRAEY